MNIDQMKATLAQLTLHYYNQSKGLERLSHDIDVLQAAIDGHTKAIESETDDGLDTD